jgi:hypothetical protein
MTNEWIYAWPVKNSSNAETITPINPGPPTVKPGWFRNKGKFSDNNWGVKENGVSSGLYFSFSLLKRSAAEGDYTMVASWADVDGKEWVPNNDKQYLHLGHNTTQGVVKNYTGPTFSTFDKADKILFHEIRDYTFKVNTPLSETTLEVTMPWSDYCKAEDIKNHIPKETHAGEDGIPTYILTNSPNQEIPLRDFNRKLKGNENDLGVFFKVTSGINAVFRMRLRIKINGEKDYLYSNSVLVRLVGSPNE